MHAAAAAAAVQTQSDQLGFSAWHAPIVVAAAVPYLVLHSLVAACLCYIRVLSAMVAIALSFHLSIDLSAPVANGCQPFFDCVRAVRLDSVCHCHYSSEHFVNLM